MEEKIVTVLNEMSEYLSITQMKKLQEVIIKTFAENEAAKVDIENEDFLNMFLAAKRIEGCSERTINYYRVTVQHLLSCTEKNVRKITTEEMREYLSNYQKRNNCSNVTIDNVRRNISSFFSWLEEEDYILKSPMKRIHKIKTKKIVKNTISDEEIEKLRDNCKEKRDLAMIDLLYSTGIRVGELVNLNIDDINFEGRECIVYVENFLSDILKGLDMRTQERIFNKARVMHIIAKSDDVRDCSIMTFEILYLTVSLKMKSKNLCWLSKVWTSTFVNEREKLGHAYYEMLNEYGKRVCGPHFTNGIRIINDTVIGRTFFWLSILYKNIEKQPFILYPQATSAATKLVEQFAEIIDIIDVD